VQQQQLQPAAAPPALHCARAAAAAAAGRPGGPRRSLGCARAGALAPLRERSSSACQAAAKQLRTTMSLEVRGVGETLGVLYGQLEDALRPVLGGLRWRVTLSEEGAWCRGGSGGGARGAGWEVRLSQQESIALLVAASLGYLVVLAAVWVLRRPLQVLLRLQDLHNLLLCTFSLVCFVFALRMMVVEGHFSSLRAAVCQPIRDPAFELLSLLFLLSKFWEWFDTVLLIVKGSEVRFLHVLHHMTTAVLYAVDHTFPSSIKYGVMVNALVVSGRFPCSLLVLLLVVEPDLTRTLW
jgi:hypothetical protein